MAYEFRLPDIGEGLHEAEILQWFVKVGDDIKADQLIVEVQTDKAAVEIDSPVGGRVVTLGGEPGDVVKVGEVLIALETSAAGVAAAPVDHSSVSSNPLAVGGGQQATSANPGEKRKVLAAPAVRKWAHDLGIDLTTITPSDASGRILRRDVERAVEAAKVSAAKTAMPTGPTAEDPVLAQHTRLAGAPSAGVTGATFPGATAMGDGKPLADRREPIRGLRKRIYENMAKSMYTAPQATGMDDLDATRLVELRQRLLPFAEARGIKLTYLPIIIKAVTYVLRDYPLFNASVDDDRMELVYKGDINIGIATATPEGLLVPVIHNADRKSVFQIAAELEDLTRRGRDRKLQLSELTGSTFTITSTGANGGWFATPIVNYPEVAILGVHSIEKRAVVLDDDSIVPQQRMSFSITFDHRVIDGEPAGRFMYRLKEYLENPELMIAF